jgi:hypothetical protein
MATTHFHSTNQPYRNHSQNHTQPYLLFLYPSLPCTPSLKTIDFSLLCPQLAEPTPYQHPLYCTVATSCLGCCFYDIREKL